MPDKPKSTPYKYIYSHKRRTVITLSIIVLAMIYLFKDSSFTLRAVATSAFLIFFYFIDHFFDIKFKIRHYIFIIIIGIAGVMLSPIYFIHPQYDKVLHFFQPILISSIVFYMISKLNLNLKWRLTFTFFIVVGILGLFEISEYILDYLFNLKLQGVYLRDVSGLEKFNLLQDPLNDTMIDLILGALGSFAHLLSLGLIKRKEFIKN